MTHFACLMSVVAIVTASHCNAAQREREGERGEGVLRMIDGLLDSASVLGRLMVFILRLVLPGERKLHMCVSVLKKH